MYHLLNLYKTRKSLTLMIFSKEKIYLKKENLTIYKLKIIPGVYNLYFEIKLPNWFSVWFQFLGFRDIWYVRQFIKFSLILVSFFSVWFAIPGKFKPILSDIEIHFLNIILNLESALLKLFWIFT